MPQRMLHLLHVVTAFMAKWLTGHGRLRLFFTAPSWVPVPAASSDPHAHPHPDEDDDDDADSEPESYPLLVAGCFFCSCVSRTSNSHVSKMLRTWLFLPQCVGVSVFSVGCSTDGSSRRHRGGCTKERRCIRFRRWAHTCVRT